ncbi:hypothetical protein F5Y18DRAFT_319842 [Xylariaceae sp. FL1019]|nr:hypothetical protein F5Y18DRAFT_319842 [Xylariaceae sp. FL1019]
MAMILSSHTRDFSLTDGSVRFDQVSVSSEEVGDKPPRRGSASLFGLGHRRTSSDVKSPPQASPEKKKHFFGSVPGITSLQVKAKSNLGLAHNSSPEESDQASTHTTEHPLSGGRNRLSELKGMIRGVGNAKEGARDEQPARVEDAYPSIPPIQNPPRNFTGQFGQPNSPKPQAMPTPQGQINPLTRTQTGPQGQLPPSESQAQAQAQQHGAQGQMQMGRAMMAGQPPVGAGRGNLTKPPSAQMPQNPPTSVGQQMKSEENGNKSTVGGFLGGLFNKQAGKGKETKMPATQQTSAPGAWPSPSHSMQSGQQFRPGQMQIPNQPLGPHPMLAGQPPFQPPPPGQSPSPGALQDSTHPPPSLETAQAVMIRRPSEITVSSQPGIAQPQSGSQSGSPNAIRQRVASPLGQPSIQRGSLDNSSGGQSETSPQLSQTTSNEHSAPGPVVARISPNRKPVGSGASKPITFQRDPSVSPSMGVPERSTASPSPTPNQRPLSSRQGLAQSPPSASSAFDNAHQHSYSSPSPSPAPSQSNQSTASTQMPGEQASRIPSDPRETGQGLGVFHNGVPHAAAPGNAPGTLQWGPNGFRPTGPATSQHQAHKPPSSPVPSMDQSKLSKFFGAYEGGKPSGQSQAAKDKSAASKFLGAFKKTKQSGAPQSRTGPQPMQVSQQPPRPGMSGALGVGRGQPHPQGPPGAGRGQTLTPQQMVALQAAAGRGQASPGPVQAGQRPPQTMPMQAGRGQMPPGAMQAGRGQTPPQMVIGPGGIPRPVQSPPPHGNEPKYDQVPIPGGYQAVHGYGGGMMISPSPYNFAPMPVQYMPYPPHMVPQGMQQGAPMRQWDPRTMPPSQGGTATQMETRPLVPSPNNQISQAQLSETHQNARQFAQQQQSNLNGQSPPPGQGQRHSQVVQRNVPDSQAQKPLTIHDRMQPNVDSLVQTQHNPHHGQSPPLSQSPASVRQPDPPTSNISSKAVANSMSSQSSVTNARTPPNSKPVWVPAPASGQRSDSEPLQSSGPESSRQQSPQVERENNVPFQPPVMPSRGQQSVLDSQSPTLGVAAGEFIRSPDATRLTSRMSVQNNMTNNTSRSFDSREDRTMSVSPEPPGPRPVPLHQVSEQASAQNLQVNTERANTRTHVDSEDIYDATPRLPSSEVHARTQSRQSHGEDQPQQNKGFVMSNGVPITSGTAAGAGAGAVIPDNMSFLAEPDSSDPEEDEPTPAGGAEPQYPPQVSPPQQASPPPPAINMEPEEKILVDMPVELAAVNDDDDGLPEMSATSYPGQEWNPYGAGEFEDYL